MTKKLKKQVNRIAIFALAVIASVIVVLCPIAKFFVMPMNQDTLETAGISETTKMLNATYTAKNEKIATMDIETAAGYTIALKQDGTVWGYGLNTSGELRNRRL